MADLESIPLAEINAIRASLGLQPLAEPLTNGQAPVSTQHHARQKELVREEKETRYVVFAVSHLTYNQFLMSPHHAVLLGPGARSERTWELTMLPPL